MLKKNTGNLLLASILTASFVLSNCTAIAAAEAYEHMSLYVSSGANNGDGSFEKPFGKIEEARDFIRKLKNDGKYPHNGVTVNMREGTYEIIESIKFNEEDSGTEEGPVTYCAYGDEDVTLVGGVDIQLTDFKKVTDSAVRSKFNKSAADAIVQYDLYKNGITREALGELEYIGVAATNHLKSRSDVVTNPCGKLFFDGEEMTIARWPNSGYATMSEIVDPGDTPRWWTDEEKASRNVEENRGFTFKITADKAKLWKDVSDARIYGFFTYMWYDGSDRIKSIDTSENTLTTKHDCSYGAAAGMPYYVYNVLEELDTPGEYYIDRDTGIMYFYPPASSGTCIVSLLDGAFFSFSDGADNIKIKNITMTTARKHAIAANNADNIGIEGCVINNVNSTAIKISGTYNTHITSCHIYNVGEHAILLAGYEDYDTLKPSGNFVENNWCHDWGKKSASYSGAVRAVGVGVRVSNNKFNSAPHLAIVTYGNDHLIEYNDISDVLKNAADSGAFYTGKSWIQRGVVIKNNYIHDLESEAEGEVYGVYLDDFFCGATVTQNIFKNINGGSDSAGIAGGARDTTITDNIFIDSNASWTTVSDRSRYKAMGEEAYDKYWQGRKKLWDEANGYGLYNDYFSESVYSKYPNIMDFDENNLEDTISYKHSVITDNVIWNCKNDRIWRAASYGGVVTTEEIEKDFIKPGVVLNSSYKANKDPGFTDYLNGDLTLKADSEIYSAIDGFKACDFENVGLYTLRLKNKLGSSIAMKVNSPLGFSEFRTTMIDDTNDKVTPMLIGETTMLPIRYIAETLGGEAEWDQSTQTAKIKAVNHELLINADTKEMTFDGEALESDVKPCIIEGRFLVPLRVIAEKFEKTVEWHDGGLIIVGDDKQYFDDNNYPETLMVGEMLRRLSY